jgi:aryl-alcohol dehydrogenase-like predicted oxidoreductase
MQYVNLGKSGLKVSRLCLGMMSYGTSSWRPNSNIWNSPSPLWKSNYQKKKSLC